MRELKFRGKSIINNEFIYGEGYYYLGEYNKAFIIKDGSEYEVLPETVGQYINLKDKNGQEVYETDIFIPRYNGFSNMVVKYEKGKYNIADYNVVNCEVVGNIHDNPDLLEEHNG